VNQRAVLRERTGPVGTAPAEIPAEKVVTVAGGIGEAASTRAAGVVTHEHVIAGRDLGDRRSDALHDARAFVAEHDRLRNREGLVAHRNVGVADAGGDESNEDLLGARLGQLERFNRERLMRSACDGGSDPHGSVR